MTITKTPTTRFLPGAIAIAIAIALAGCGSDGSNSPSNTPENNTPSDNTSDDNSTPSTDTALIEYTSYGVPHISASNIRSLYYGQGYAHAQENMCTLAKEIIGVRAELAKTFGAGYKDSNVNADFATQALGIYPNAEKAVKTLDEQDAETLTGYVNGFNQAVADKNGVYPSPCSGDNAYPIPTVTVTDLYAYHLKLALFASGSALASQVATATLPAPQQVTSLSSFNTELNEITKNNQELGSNGWALGKDKTESGHGMLLSNPHFPWSGSLRFVENQLTIDGELNVTGVSFVGVPGVLIGFNDNIAWTHTVSQSKRFTAYHLTLKDGDPTQYKYDDEYRQMSSQEYTVQVLQADGSLQPQTRTLYSSHYGPIIGWKDGAQTYRDANQGNENMVKQWLAMNRASNLAEFEQAFADYQGIPWVNTMAADKSGTAYFIDGSRTANLLPQVDMTVKQLLSTPPQTDEAVAMQYSWQEGRGQLILDGSNSMFEWVDTGTTPVEGVVPFEKAPRLTRSDYVFNANSSPWLTNLDAPIEDFSIVYGPADSIRSPRTRMNAVLLQEASANGVSGADGKFNLEELKSVVTGERGMSSELLKDELSERCSAVNKVVVDGTTIDITTACQLLSEWDGLYRNDSVGAPIFREFLKSYYKVGERWLSADLFETPFDPANPVATPSGLKLIDDTTLVDEDPALIALGKAVQTLQAANIALDTPLKEVQYAIKGEERIAIPGGGGLEGVFNINSSGSLPVTNSNYVIRSGASWVMALEFTEDGPKADAFLTYSQSHDPESPHYADQTRLFSRGEWRPVIFTKEAIANDLVDSITLTTH
ncbi:acyl-homoserine-lactone acylase [Sinobacterium caligoides]|uniref:Acyl-homoserine-lactone acylase n=1 Tax=Sinobacterium caligoides TaxID=933926 RepID=A0A3N2DGC3_9GAMM|nr:penicillin acylase family protein [Sinobacterium caligoides]ROR98781.1 acyl-homoserine-lactone acylase [Sinobacterium caligoides]